MENEKISCSSGRVKIIDPNDFQGFNSSSNVPVQLEDLNISVVLTSYRKPRTLLTLEDNNSGFFRNTKKIDVRFIEGSEIGGKKSLTTKFTDLTTVFDTDVINNETLGITSIDIEFNPSNTPMITINFVDVRGSSIFQNEENILNNEGNKYTTFFQLPYPMFELEIKGFYGLPVKFCLHLYKFNSKFNSQTGNFEITANFIGFTFALMSDMLLGYLRAIPYTTIGAKRLKNYRETANPNVLTIDELSKKVQRINQGIKKQTSENEISKEWNAVKRSVEIIDDIKAKIKLLDSNINFKSQSNASSEYIISQSGSTANTDKKTYIDLYKSNVELSINEYNTLVNDGLKLELKDFKNIELNNNQKGGKLYKNVTIEELKATTSSGLKTKLGNNPDIEQTKQSILKFIDANYNSQLNDKTGVDIYDMSLLIKTLDEKKTTLTTKEEEVKTKLAEDFAKNVRKELTFDPTIRPLVECFTAAIEIFAETIYTVSANAIANSERKAELAKKFNSTDVNAGDYTLANLNSANPEYYPWPDYREKEQGSTYVEKYLGANNVLTNPQKVDELVFIDELLTAFRTSKQAEEDVINNSVQSESAWFPNNVFDSKIFSEIQPYKSNELLKMSDVIRIMTIRAMTFLGYSYMPTMVSDAEILAFAELEANLLLSSIDNKILKQSIASINQQNITGDGSFFRAVKGLVGDDPNEIDVIKQDGDYVVYNYIFDKNDWKVLPVNKGFNKYKWEPTFSNLKKARDEDNAIFFTNYSDACCTNDPNNPIFFKSDDGGTYIKILDSLPTAELLSTLPQNITSDSVMLLEKLKLANPDKTAGFNVFGGSYGTQEFKNMDWGDKSLENLPLRYVFYSDTSTGLALTRSETAKKLGLKSTETVSNYSFKINNIITREAESINITKTKNFYKSISDNYTHDSLGKNRLLFKNNVVDGSSEVTYPYVELRQATTSLDPYGYNKFSLFGSELYYSQDAKAFVRTDNNKLVSCSEYSKAFLFLQTLPFNILYGDDLSIATTFEGGGGPFTNFDVINLFKNSSGLIHAPRLWCAYIGSILWRNSGAYPIFDNNNKIIGGGRGGNYKKVNGKVVSAGDIVDPIYINPDEFEVPSSDEYFPVFLNLKKLFVGGIDRNPTYPNIKEEHLITRLPYQVQDEFKRIFFEFVNGTGEGTSWRDLADELEIFDSKNASSYYAFKGYLNSFSGKLSIDTKDILNYRDSVSSYGVKTDIINKNYYVVVPSTYVNPNLNYMFLELEDGSDAVKKIINALNEEVTIANSTYRIWVYYNTNNNKERTPIKVKKDKFDLYFNKLMEVFKTKGNAYEVAKEEEQKKVDFKIFGTTNKDVIRLQLYRNCKNIYDKWLGGSESVDNLIFQCGSRSLVDTELAKKYTNNPNATPRMIDSFRFVSRSFKDIGDLLYVNPLPINEILLGNPNVSAYDVIAKLLASNKFTFQPLPNFINYRDDKLLAKIFKPYNYGEDIPKGSCGPSFVCAYAGQTSKHLDYGSNTRNNNAHYPNDGFDLRCIKDNNMSVNAPSDFISDSSSQGYEEPISAFVVKYSQQNQNIFKDIILDQSEHSETDESLQIQDELSQKGAENNRALVGQNIYNIYSVRSYTAKIEMMGNAMIQPMMYFQLDNIPMFHGAYLITKVTHSIKPNTMSTNFTGTRIRYPETPLLTAYDVYMEFLSTIDTTTAGVGVVSGGGGGAVPKSAAPILQTLIDNGCVGSNINSGYIKPCKVGKIKGISFQMNPNTQMICEAVEPLTKMLTDWVEWMKSEKFKPVLKENGDDIYAYITSMFRTDNSSSMHAYGLAVDFQFFSKDFKTPLTGTNRFKNEEENVENVKYAFDFSKNQALKWLYQHSYEYGFVQPHWANDGNKVGSSDGEEWWHWEYHGKAAIYQIRNRPIPALGNNKASDNPLSEIKESKIKPFVHNPKGKDGKEAVYTNMDYKTSRVSDKANKIYTSVDDYPKGPVTVKDQPLSSLKVNANTMMFYDKLLDKLGAPKTDGNKFLLIAWHQIENSTCNWNAFNTKQQYGSSTPCITSGVNKNVQNYNNMDEGVNGTYKTLINGNYPNLIAALKAGIKDKQQAYNVAVSLQQAPKGDFCVWKEGGVGCKRVNGVPINTYVAQILSVGKMTGKNIAGS